MIRKLAFAFLFILTASVAHAQSYSTNFPATENPISQSGNWLNGAANGLDWGNVQTTPGLAFGTTVSGGPPYNDSVAALTGSWPTTQSACATVAINSSFPNRNSGPHELELHLHRTITAHSSTGYEFNYGLGTTSGAGFLYAGTVRWNGALNNFTGLGGPSGTPPVLNNGDVFCATASATGVLTATVTRAGTTIVTWTFTDTTYTNGSPGIGFYNQFNINDNSLYGFSSFTTPSTGGPATYTASSCNQGDVNEVINGSGGTTPPISPHNAIDGDTIHVPAGSCTWTGSIPVASNIGIQIIGACTPNTLPSQFGAGTVTTNITHGGFSMSPRFGNSLSRISCFNFIPSAGAGAPIVVNGTCTAAGCANFRLDNTFYPQTWANQGLSDAAVAPVSNVFGVADHNTVGDTSAANYMAFLNLGNSGWQGIGDFGDNSWANAPTFGTAQTFYLENNLFVNAQATDTDIPDGTPGGGGARFACRFNQANPMMINGYCTGHGTETTGRPRGVAQYEAYFNTGNCTNTMQGCGSAWPGRSGTGYSFNNTFTNSGGGFAGGLNNMDPQRRWRAQTQDFGGCSNSPYDTIDGGSATPTIYASGTVTAASQIVLSNTAYKITTSGTWGGGFTPLSYGAPYTFWDVTGGFGFEIQNYTTNTLTVYSGCQSNNCGNGGGPIGFPAIGDSYQIRRTTVCLDQPTRLGPSTLYSTHTTPTPQSPANEALVPSYEAADSFPGSVHHTLSSNTYSIIPDRDFYAEAVGQPAQTSATAPFSGTAVTQAITGWTCNNGTGLCVFNIASTTGFVIGSYANIADVLRGTTNNSNPSGTWPITNLVTNTSVTVQFAGFSTDVGPAGGGISTLGIGHGTLANRPTTCTTGVGYWATDQGTWDMSGGGHKGLLYTCTSTNTWSLTYTPACYPNTLIPGSPCSGVSPAPVVNLSPSSLAFGNVLVGSTSAAQNITLSNTGTATLTISSIAVGGTNLADFSQTNNCSGSVAVGGSCTIVVKFAPLSAASFSANITVTDNAAGSPHTAGLSGTGTNATAGIGFAPTSVAFTAQLVGTSSSPTAITITNTGGANLVITNVSIVGGNSTSFSQTNNCGTVVPAGTCTINATFSPQVAGALASSVAVTDNAAGSPQTVPLTGTGTGVAGISFTPTSLPFGNEVVGGTTAALSTTVKNTGSATLTLSSITLTGTNLGDYAISANSCGGSLTVNSTCIVSVTFTPSATGSRVANLTFTDNAAGSPQNVALTGTGTQAGTGFMPTSLAFGNQNVSTTSAPMTTTLTNTGSATLNIASITLTGTNASDFARTTTCGATLAPAGTCTVSVTFTPAAQSNRSANLSFTDDAPGSPQTVPLTGVGVVVANSLSIVPSTITFPATVVGQSSASQTITVTASVSNPSPISFANIVVTGGNAADFSIVNGCPTMLNPAASCQVTVTFKPLATGARASAVVFTDSASGSPQSVAISGTGTQAGAQVSPTVLTFGNQPVGTTSAPQTVTLTNNGTATLNVASIALRPGDSYFAISSNTCGSTLAVSTSCNVSVTFTPQTAINVTMALSFTDDGPNSPQVVTGSGTGTSSALSFNPASLIFPNTAVSTTSAGMIITVLNTGNGAISISSIVVTGTNASNFAQTNNCGTTLGGNSSCTVTVKFTPSANGSRTAAVTFTDSAPASPQSVSLQGTGFVPAPQVSLSIGSVAFGNQTTGSSSNSQVVMLTNTGTASLTISSTSITGTNPGDFGSSTTCTASLAVNASCTYSFVFTPTAAGARSATFNLVTTAASSPDHVSLAGTGISSPNGASSPQTFGE